MLFIKKNKFRKEFKANIITRRSNTIIIPPRISQNPKLIKPSYCKKKDNRDITNFIDE